VRVRELLGRRLVVVRLVRLLVLGHARRPVERQSFDLRSELGQ